MSSGWIGKVLYVCIYYIVELTALSWSIDLECGSNKESRLYRLELKRRVYKPVDLFLLSDIIIIISPIRSESITKMDIPQGMTWRSRQDLQKKNTHN